MNLNIFSELPTYVRITILSQIKRLMVSPLFSNDDKEDLVQDFLLFYLRRFNYTPPPDEALVVHSIKQYATTLIVKRHNRRDFLNSSLADYDTDGEFSFLNTKPDFDDKILWEQLIKELDDKEKAIFNLMCDGCSMNQITAKIHIHKRVVRRFLEKMQKKLK